MVLEVDTKGRKYERQLISRNKMSQTHRIWSGTKIMVFVPSHVHLYENGQVDKWLDLTGVLSRIQKKVPLDNVGKPGTKTELSEPQRTRGRGEWIYLMKRHSKSVFAMGRDLKSKTKG